MYLEHFGLQRLPFTIAPDPDLLYLSRGHQEALAHLHYALTGHGGLVCLTGEVGTGKTTLCRAFLHQLPAHVRSAYLFNPQLSATELLHSLCDELGIVVEKQASPRELFNRLNHELLQGYAAGQRFICIIDEAQSMPVPLLEQVRLLTNLETDKEKLLTVILVGQPELRQQLARYDLRQLSQRITARYHLQHLSFSETRAYLQHRCRLAGAERPLFSVAAQWQLWRASGGIPRLLNSLADRALLGAYANGKTLVTPQWVRGAQREILPARAYFSPHGKSGWRLSPGSLVLLLLILLPALWWWLPSLPRTLEAVVLSSGSSGQHLAATDHAAGPALNPVHLLGRELGLPAVQDCSALPAQGWRCLWLEWPLEYLQRLAVPVAVPQAGTSGTVWQLAQHLAAGARLSGRSLVLWQPPASFDRKLIRPGNQHDTVRWVRQRLGVAAPSGWQVIGPQGQSSQPDDGFYDPLLAQAVLEFQQQHGLKADRILGPQTLFMLWLQEG